MKKTYDCSHCRDQLDTTKTAFVFSPMRGECIHLRCFTNALSYDIAHELGDTYIEEGNSKKKRMAERKKERKTTDGGNTDRGNTDRGNNLHPI